MPQPQPTKLVVEFEDGTRAEALPGDLPSVLWEDLLRQPFASVPSSSPEEDKFVLIEWEDGWKEVVGVPSDCSEINRYRVIERPEEIGRLSLTRSSGYPELVEIQRRPSQVRRITFGRTFALETGKTLREGRKREVHFRLSEDRDSVSQLKAQMADVLREEGIDVGALSNPAGDAARRGWKVISDRLGLKAAFRQQDLFDFLNRLAAGGAS